MDAIQTIVNEINRYLSANDIYNTYKDTWQYLLESYVGGAEYRDAGHLTRYQLETDNEYQARLRNTPLQNHCASVISVYNSFIFRKPPTRYWNSTAMTPQLEDFLVDADQDGRSFNAFMQDVATYNSIFGHTWVVVAKPNINATSLADEIAAGVRPYVSLLTPLVVLDWQWTRNVNGRYELAYFKYIEDINGDVTTVKEWTKDYITTAVINESATKIESETVEPNGLGVIPAVIAYGKRSIIRGIGVSDIADIADSQRFIYNATSEIDQSIRLDSHPSLVKTADTNAGIGAGSLIHMPENLDPGLKPYILEFSGASVDKILTTIQHTIESIDKMANTGAVRATAARTMSGVAMETEFQLLNARLSEKANALALAEEQIWKLWAKYQGQEWDGTIEYPDSFNIRDAANDLEFYLKATTAQVNSDTWNKEVQKSIVRTVLEEDNPEMDTIVEEIDSYEMPTFAQMIPADGGPEVMVAVTEPKDPAMLALELEAKRQEMAQEAAESALELEEQRAEMAQEAAESALELEMMRVELARLKAAPLTASEDGMED